MPPRSRWRFPGACCGTSPGAARRRAAGMPGASTFLSARRLARPRERGAVGRAPARSSRRFRPNPAVPTLGPRLSAEGRSPQHGHASSRAPAPGFPSVMWTVKWDDKAGRYTKDPPNQEPYNFVWSPQVGAGRGGAGRGRDRAARFVGRGRGRAAHVRAHQGPHYPRVSSLKPPNNLDPSPPPKQTIHPTPSTKLPCTSLRRGATSSLRRRMVGVCWEGARWRGQGMDAGACACVSGE
jgi:hypothetical protein